VAAEDGALTVTNGMPKIEEEIYEANSKRSRLDSIWIKTKGIKELRQFLPGESGSRMKKRVEDWSNG
jgi:hypothetical protein